MKPIVLLSVLFHHGRAVSVARPLTAASSCPTVSLNASTNIWTHYTLQSNPFYRQQVLNAAKVIQDADLQKKALKIADVGSFFWLSKSTEVEKVTTLLEDMIPCNHVVGIVLQGMYSQANCTSPKYRSTELAAYKASFIDPLATIIKSNPTTAFAVIVEPSTLPSVIIHSDLPSCAPAIETYRTNIPYALEALNLPNVVTYLDAGHGGNLGWDKLQIATANEIAFAYNASSRPSQLRGIAVNTANWNSWDMSPGEFTQSALEIWPENHAQNEQRYVSLLGAKLAKVGAPNHAVVDTSRNGVQGLRYEWLDWCNVDGAGFGRRPGVVGGANELADAFIWAVGGGVSDGTSEEGEEGYDEYCGKPGAYKPSPPRGQWNQAYFEVLLREARPWIHV